MCGAVGDKRPVFAHDRVLVSKSRAANVDAARVHVQHVVEPGWDEVAAMGLQDERLDPPFAELLVAARVLAQVLDARDLEPDEVARVVRDPLSIGVGEPDADVS